MRMMALLLALLPGCYLGGRAGVDTSRNRDATVGTGALDLGIGASDDHQSGEALLSIGASPLVGADETRAPRMPLALFGGRYERAFTSAHPSVRGFGRVLFGGNLCSTGEDDPMEPDSSCDSAAEQRDIGVASFALGVVLTKTGDRARSDELTPPKASVGLAVVYTYASDAALGADDFLGVELSFGFGGDVLTPMMRRDGH